MIGRLNKLEVAAGGILDKVIYVSMLLAAILLVVWPFVFTGSIIVRNYFHASTAYLEEYTGYWTLIITCFALAYTFRRGGHIRVDVVVKYLPPRAKNIVEIVVAFVALITSSILAEHGIKLLIFAIRENIHCTFGTTLLWPVYLWIPFGYGLLSLALLLYFCRTILVVLKKD